VLKSVREDAAVGCFVQESVVLLEKNEAKAGSSVKLKTWLIFICIQTAGDSGEIVVYSVNRNHNC